MTLRVGLLRGVGSLPLRGQHIDAPLAFEVCFGVRLEQGLVSVVIEALVFKERQV